MITNGPPPAATFVRRSIGNAHLDFTLAGAAARRFAALAVLQRSECRVTLSTSFFFVSRNLAHIISRRAVYVVDVSNPAKPVLRGTYVLPASAYAVFASNDLIYVADGPAGLWILRYTGPGAASTSP